MTTGIFEGVERVLNDARRGWPTIEDFERRRVWLDDALICSALHVLQESGRLLIRAAEGRGKTVLARTIAYEKHKSNCPVFFIDASRLDLNTTANVRNLISDIGNSKTLFVVENAHSAPASAMADFIELLDRVDSSFLFTVRQVGSGRPGLMVENPFEEWVERGWVLELAPNTGAAIEIIKTQLACRGIEYSLDEADLAWIEANIGGANLRRLKWFLESWFNNGGRLSTVTRREVYEMVWREHLRPLDPPCRSLLREICSIAQFDVPFDGAGRDENALNRLIAQGLVSFVPGYYYRLQHSSDAAYIMEADATLVEMSSPEAATLALLTSYVRREPRNWHELLRALATKPFGLRKLLADHQVRDVLLHLAPLSDLPRVMSVARSLLSAGFRSTARDLWKAFVDALGEDDRARDIELRRRIEESSASTLAAALFVLRRLSPSEHRRFVALGEQKWLEAAKTLNLRALEKLIRGLPVESRSAVLKGLGSETILSLFRERPGSFQTLVWLLSSCNRSHSDKTYAKRLACEVSRGVPAEELVSQTRSGSLGSAMMFLDMVDLPQRRLILRSLDSSSWAAKARPASLRVLTRFLQFCTEADEAQIARDVMASLITPEFLLRLKAGPADRTLKFTGLVRDIDRVLWRVLKRNQSPKDEAARVLTCPVGTLAGQLYRLHTLAMPCASFLEGRMGKPEIEEIADDVASALASKGVSAEDALKVEYLKAIGKVLLVLSLRCSDKSRSSLLAFTKDIVERVRLDHKHCPPGALSYLMDHISRIDPGLYQSFCERIANEYDVDALARIPLEPGVAYLIWRFLRSLPEMARRLKSKILSLRVRETLAAQEAGNLGLLIWNLLQIDRESVKAWVAGADLECWHSVVGLATAQGAFRILWTLWEIDSSVVQSLLGRLDVHSIAIRSSQDPATILPLLGLFRFAAAKSQFDRGLLPPVSEVNAWAEGASILDLAMGVYFLRATKPDCLRRVRTELAREWFMEGRLAALDRAIEEQPSPTARRIIHDGLADFLSADEPHATFAEIARMVEVESRRSGEKWLDLESVSRRLCAAHRSGPVFRDLRQANAWMCLAIEHGLLSYRYTLDSQEERVITLISLNDGPAMQGESSHRADQGSAPL